MGLNRLRFLLFSLLLFVDTTGVIVLTELGKVEVLGEEICRTGVPWRYFKSMEEKEEYFRRIVEELLQRLEKEYPLDETVSRRKLTAVITTQPGFYYYSIQIFRIAGYYIDIPVSIILWMATINIVALLIIADPKTLYPVYAQIGRQRVIPAFFPTYASDMCFLVHRESLRVAPRDFN